ncbi:MAG TPA: glycosyltransferase, partial [Phycisphaerae bacterium]|nr:glycosyltransferase [Phycisphaerae bacterium]
HHIVDPEKIKIIPPGICPASEARCFDSDGEDQVVSIVLAGDLVSYHAFSFALDSLSELHQSGCDCAFFVMGPGPAERRLRLKADRLGITDVLTFVGGGVDQQLSDVYKSADVFISPAPSDKVNMQSLLAMSAGLPVLAPADTKDDFLIDHETALLFEPRSSKDLNLKLEGLFFDRARTRAMVEKALDYLRANHSPSAMVSATAAAYRSMNT